MNPTRFTINEVATLAHLVGRNAESLLLSEDLTPETQELIFKALGTVDVAVTLDNRYTTAIPGGKVGISLNNSKR